MSHWEILPMPATDSASPLHERLLAVTGERTYRKIGEMTSTHPETVRRYLQGQSPSVEFVTALCKALSISGEWLLTGEGPMRIAEAKQHALRQADPGELLSAIAGTLDELGDRLDRVELFVQSLESRVRGSQSASPGARPGGPHGSPAAAQRTQAHERARHIGEVIAKRPSQAAG